MITAECMLQACPYISSFSFNIQKGKLVSIGRFYRFLYILYIAVSLPPLYWYPDTKTEKRARNCRNLLKFMIKLEKFWRKNKRKDSPFESYSLFILSVPSMFVNNPGPEEWVCYLGPNRRTFPPIPLILWCTGMATKWKTHNTIFIKSDYRRKPI